MDEIWWEDPAIWLGLMGRKVAYLFNDWEQYNNLSYGYQKARFTFLRFNPLGWGCLLLGAICRRSEEYVVSRFVRSVQD